VPRPSRVFLSHSAKNRAFVDRLADVLAGHGVSTWYSRHSIRGAQQWHDEIGAALRRCHWFLLVLSPQAAKSKWVKRELMYALQADRYENHIIPLTHRRCDHAQLSWTLSSFEFVDFTRDFDDGCAELLRIWKMKYRGEAQTRSRRGGRRR
jgi:hypothetical protein